MKKAILTGFFGVAFALVFASCGGNGEVKDTVADTAVAPETTECMHHCQMTCPDSTCLAANCENCTCPDSSACHKKPCCKKDGEGCVKAEGEGCKKGEGECCKKEQGK